MTLWRFGGAIIENQHRKYPGSFLPWALFLRVNLALCFPQICVHQHTNPEPDSTCVLRSESQMVYYLITDLKEIVKQNITRSSCRYVNFWICWKDIWNCHQFPISEFGEMNSEMQCRCSGLTMKAQYHTCQLPTVAKPEFKQATV